MSYKTSLFLASFLGLTACQAQTDASAKATAPTPQASVSIELPHTPVAETPITAPEAETPITAPEAAETLTLVKTAAAEIKAPPIITAPAVIKTPVPVPATVKVAQKIITPAAIITTPPAIVKVNVASPAVIQKVAVITPRAPVAPAVMAPMPAPSVPQVQLVATLPIAATKPEITQVVTVPRPVQTAQVASKAPEIKADTMATNTSPNAAYNNFLAKYVVPSGGINLVRYADVSASDKASLDAYIETLSQSGAPVGSKEAVMAYWFNLYNAKTVSLILDNYPISSIKKISGPWKKKRLIVAGQRMSLNNIEHDTIRAAYDEPRVHYAFNCASIGCPNLKMTAWEAETLDADLTQAAKDFVASPRGVSVDSKGRIDASNIYKWYKEDFGGSEKGILAHIEPYAIGEKKAAILSANKIDDFDYDWSLNIAN